MDLRPGLYRLARIYILEKSSSDVDLLDFDPNNFDILYSDPESSN